MMEENIKRIILKYQQIIPSHVISRDTHIPNIRFDKAQVIVGPRRAGKTFLLYEQLKKEKNPVFINFEDNLLDGLSKADLNTILEIAKELMGTVSLSFFFDEIQAVEGWEKFVVSLLNEHYPVYVTGSNSRLLSRDIATSLRGKSLAHLLLPLSFKEYLRFQNITLEKNFAYTNQAYALKKYCKDYITYGGFPEVILSDTLLLKDKLINNYFDSVLYKDMVDRLQLKNIKLVELTMKYLLNIFGNTFSIAAFENYLKTNKIPYSLEDVYTILKAVQDVFMVGFVKEYHKSFKKSEISKSRVYLFDTGYVHFLANEAADYGRILENIVFIELFRREGTLENRNIFYFKNKHECDFIVMEKAKPKQIIQVSYIMDEKNKQRELQGLLEALDFFKKKEGLIITLDQKEEFTVDGKKIKVVPLWEWLLK